MPRSFTLENVKVDHRVLFNLSRLFAQEEGTCLLHSGGQYDTAEKSLLFLFPFDFIRINGHKQIRAHSNEEPRLILSMENPWEALKSMLSFNHQCDFPEWIGFFEYEMGAYSDHHKTIEGLHPPRAYFQRCAIVLIVNHQNETGLVWVADQAEYFLNEKQRHWFERLSNCEQWKALIQTVSYHDEVEDILPSLSLASPIETEVSYTKKVELAKELIRAGEIYQINLSHKIDFQGYIDAFQLFHRLSLLNPAPFSAYLKLRELTIVSTSPELFLKKKGDRMETRPIKGTAARGKTQEEDHHNKTRLLGSLKERAELLMITDLMRNDLGKISLPGTVEVPQIWRCDAYPNVFHLSSVVCSKLLSGLHPIEVIRACFPGGSITGCPKLRAMEVIRDLEKRHRGIYTGSIGYLTSQGNFDFNIAIRTVVISNDMTTVQLGGAVVADSDPSKEYEETLYKGKSIFKGLNFALSQSI